MKLDSNTMKILLLFNVVIIASKEDYSPVARESHSYTNMHQLTLTPFKKEKTFK